jgi:hypothetical protein
MIIFLMVVGPPEGALMRRHAGGVGCAARGRERTLLPHSGGAGAPPGGHYEPPARSMATGAGPPAASFAIAANTPGTTDGNRKARPAL